MPSKESKAGPTPFFEQNRIIILYDCRDPETVKQWTRDREHWKDRSDQYYLHDRRVALIIRTGIGSAA